MPAVFVHGVPDTQRLWRPVLSRLARRDGTALSLPGFGCAAPDGFPATKEAYVEWLRGEIERVGEPVDIVGHDWGALLVMRVASLHPELVRSWAAGAAPIDRAYTWHETAQLWQTPAVGEQVMDAMEGDVLVDGLVGGGMPRAYAEEAVRHIDATMKRCILALYRSAVHVGDEWQDDLVRMPRPGLVLWGEADPFVTPEFGARLAERTGARFALLRGCQHWWPAQRPDEVAAELERLWASAA